MKVLSTISNPPSYFFIGIVIGIILIFIAVVYHLFHSNEDAIEMVDLGEVNEDVMKVYKEHRQHQIEQFLEHCYLWCCIKENDSRLSVVLNEDDTHTVRVVNDDLEVFACFDWSRQIIHLQLLVYDGEEREIDTVSAAISMKNDIIDYNKMFKVIDNFLFHFSQIPNEEVINATLQIVLSTEVPTEKQKELLVSGCNALCRNIKKSKKVSMAFVQGYTHLLLYLKSIDEQKFLEVLETNNLISGIEEEEEENT